MELKEARYILAIAKHQSIGKAAESLYISQPSLSKYLKNLEERLGAPLFDRRENHYYPTYMGERYLYYAERIAAFGDQWSQEFDDIAHQEKGRLNIAAPIMMGTTLIEPSLMGFHKRHPYVTLNIMEAINFVAENSLEDNSIDLTIYNVHKFPENMDYQILRKEEIVLVLNKNHPLCKKAQTKEGFLHPWLDLKMLEKEKSFYIRTRIPAASHSLYLKNIPWNQQYSFTPATVLCPSAWRSRDSELPLPQKAIFGKNPAFFLKDAAFPLVQNRCSPLPLLHTRKRNIFLSMPETIWKS